MKHVTEFPSFILSKAVTTKTSLSGEGKTPEEIQTNLGETFKFEGDKLKHFVASLDVAAQNANNLRRILVVSLNEGENVPAKAVKVEEHYYIPEFLVLSAPVKEASEKGGRRGGKRRDGPKGSPWGMTPEEKAAKNKPKATTTT